MSVWAAVEERDLDGVKATVENGADIEGRGGFWEETALHYPCWGGYFSITEFHIQCGAQVKCRDKCDYLPIYCACMRVN